MRAAGGQHAGEIGGAVGAVLVGAEVEADGDGTAPAGGEAGGDGVHPVIVEAEAVDGGAVFRQAEKARFRVARLRAGGGGADLDEAEACAGEGGQGGGVLVIACGEAHGVRQRQARERGFQPGRGDGAGQGREARLQRPEREAMGHLGIEAVEEGQRWAFEQGHQTPSGKMWPVAPRGRDLSQTTSDRVSLR